MPEADWFGSRRQGDGLPFCVVARLRLGGRNVADGLEQAVVVSLLGRQQGATLDELVAATGWLPHTTRAALTDLRRRGYSLQKDAREGGGRAYSIQAA